MAATVPLGGVKQHLTQGHSSLGSKWETLAALSEEQQAAVSELGQACAEQPVPEAVLVREAETAQTASELQPPPTPASPTAPGSPCAGLAAGNTHPPPAAFQDVVLQHSSDFYRWLSELEAARGEEAAARFGACTAQLAAHVASTEAVLDRLSGAGAALDSAAAAHAAVSAAGASLAAPCEALEAARAGREALVAALRSRLSRFDEVERLAGEAAGAGAGGSADPVALLTRLDAALDFLASHPHWMGAATAAASLRQLQARTLGALRSRVAAVLRSAAAAVVAERARLSSDKSTAVDGGANVQPATANVQPATASVQPATANVQPATATAQSSAGAGGLAPPAAATANTAAGSSDTNTLPDGSASEDALLTVRFRAAAEPGIGPLLAGIESRAGERADYARLLADCQAAYCATRVSLLAPDVVRRVSTAVTGQSGSSEMDGLQPVDAGDRALAAAVRGSVRHLRRLLREETTLFAVFFPRSPPRRALVGLADPLTQRVYDGLRPRVVAARSPAALAAAVDAVEAAATADKARRTGGGRGAAPPPADDEAARELLAPMLRRLLGDLRERLIFRAQTFVRERVSGHRDLPRGWDSSSGSGGGGGGSANNTGHDTAGNDSAVSSQSSASSPEAYPPVAATLYLLNLLAPRLEAQTFAGVAHEALAAATQAVLSAGRSLGRVAGGAAVSSSSAASSACLPPSLQAQLFVVAQLLALRGGAAAHPGAFSVVERDLDFSHTRDTLRRAAAGKLPLFTLAPSSVVVQLLSRGAPRLAESTSDAKRELDRELKTGCETLIMGVTKAIVDPALSFLSKAAAASGQGSSDSAAATTKPDRLPSKPLCELAFASPERVAELMARLRQGLRAVVPGAAAALISALPDGDARRAMTGPIAANVREAIGQLSTLLEKEYPAGSLAPGVVIQTAELDAALAALET